MLFSIGTRVRFKYTGETGTITAQLDSDMLQVRLDSDPSIEIPAFEDDLERNISSEKTAPGAKFIQGKQEKKPEPPPRREIKAQYMILKPKGLQLGFEPMYNRDGTVTQYKIWLINDTGFEFLVEFDLYAGDRRVLGCGEKIGATTVLEIGDMLYDELNESPEVDISIQRITTAGPEEPLFKTLKIKPKQFFNSFQTAPILNILAYLFLVFDSFEQPARKASDNDLKDYTRQNARKERPSSVQQGHARPFHTFNIEEFAHFEPEIDLHIENLTNGFARLDKSEILRLQLLHFERFMDKAIRLGVSRVFIIHGMGEGKLKEAIASKLREYPEVHKFKNEYHHKYGYGATEVLFQH
ncbi:MAG: Smr/MutS family protein [Saprospiraceae bacterium]